MSTPDLTSTVTGSLAPLEPAALAVGGVAIGIGVVFYGLRRIWRLAKGLI